MKAQKYIFIGYQKILPINGAYFMKNAIFQFWVRNVIFLKTNFSYLNHKSYIFIGYQKISPNLGAYFKENSVFQ